MTPSAVESHGGGAWGNQPGANQAHLVQHRSGSGHPHAKYRPWWQHSGRSRRLRRRRHAHWDDLVRGKPSRDNPLNQNVENCEKELFALGLGSGTAAHPSAPGRTCTVTWAGRQG